MPEHKQTHTHRLKNFLCKVSHRAPAKYNDSHLGTNFPPTHQMAMIYI